jgi:hypothetical protein
VSPTNRCTHTYMHTQQHTKLIPKFQIKPHAHSTLHPQRKCTACTSSRESLRRMKEITHVLLASMGSVVWCRATANGGEELVCVYVPLCDSQCDPPPPAPSRPAPHHCVRAQPRKPASRTASSTSCCGTCCLARMAVHRCRLWIRSVMSDIPLKALFGDCAAHLINTCSTHARSAVASDFE